MTNPSWHPLIDGIPPAWADGWGQDRHGVFAEFALGKVVQRLRWIPPGRFMMGSPEDEPERFGNEGPQHEVTMAQGFWLCDTACPQELWQAVMGENPGHFKDPKQPVETVSFDDVQGFLAKINSILPGLELTLPSEAQWEYACRAGTETPFSFGENITPGQVNYDGNRPYAGGAKGDFRGKTVPVASLPANPWGLFEMHGNVWEWCGDTWHDSYEGAPTDGRAWVEDASAVVRRVIRGGSWISSTLFVRAACRTGGEPSHRFNTLGFRCARVHG